MGHFEIMCDRIVWQLKCLAAPSLPLISAKVEAMTGDLV
jgi:hypothetical protein